MGNIVPEDDGVERLPNPGELIEVGQWYWVTDKDGEWLGCVTGVGSNYVKMTSPESNSYVRIHIDRFDKKCRRESDPERVIRGYVEDARKSVEAKLVEIREYTQQIGMEKGVSAGEETRALSVISGTESPKKYKKALVKAKEKDLPKLFGEVEEATKTLTTWMKAQALPVKALAEGMKGVIEKIDDRIFTVSLYAGLTEEVKKIADGPPARADTKFSIFQRLLYMDEECLANYRHGGMRFRHLPEFDRWLAEPENVARIFGGFPRAMVAFRVRRDRSELEIDGDTDLGAIFAHFQEAQLDKLTFLYIKNGAQLYRLNCDLEFGDLIYPGKDELKRRLDFSEPMMGSTSHWVRHGPLITRAHYDELVKAREEWRAKSEAWRKANPSVEWIREPSWVGHVPYELDNLDEYEPFDSSSTEFDDLREEVEKRIKYYNRIVLIVQGLFDRSDVLHPHPPVKLWTPEGFAAAIDLVHDGSGVLHYGEPPDFEAYRARVNATLGAGSLTVGQEDFWERHEAVRENARRDNDWRWKSNSRVTKFSPYGNPGPGYLARVVRVRGGKVLFEWSRKRLRDTWSKRYGDPIPTSILVPKDKLLNVSAYKLGDYKQFYADPRTRAQYLKWASMLIAAEEYHANPKKAKIGSSLGE